MSFLRCLSLKSWGQRTLKKMLNWLFHYLQGYLAPRNSKHHPGGLLLKQILDCCSCSVLLNNTTIFKVENDVLMNYIAIPHRAFLKDGGLLMTLSQFSNMFP